MKKYEKYRLENKKLEQIKKMENKHFYTNFNWN